MIVGLGLDVTELDRINAVRDRFGDRFARRILSETEFKSMPGGVTAVPWLAARFAAKEAGAKALGTGFTGGIAFSHIEIVPQPSGKPEILFHGPAREAAKRLGAARAFVSLTHGRDVAAAVVILEADIP